MVRVTCAESRTVCSPEHNIPRNLELGYVQGPMGLEMTSIVIVAGNEAMHELARCQK